VARGDRGGASLRDEDRLAEGDNTRSIAGRATPARSTDRSMRGGLNISIQWGIQSARHYGANRMALSTPRAIIVTLSDERRRTRACAVESRAVLALQPGKNWRP
jgi:hypothetical protein